MRQRKRVLVVPTLGTSLDAPVAPRFGRSPRFAVIEVIAGRVAGARSVENPHAAEERHDHVPSFVAGLGANVVLAQGMGDPARQALEALGVDVVVGVEGTVVDVVRSWLEGRVKIPLPRHLPHAPGPEEIQ
jgi:predicted Fe-Mo cluster-binding NifX family protein